MAARWVGLSRPSTRSIAARRALQRGIAHTLHECVHAISAVGMLLLAAAMNFALYPDALAAVVSGERPIVSFVPNDPSLNAALAPTAAPRPVDEAEVRLLAATAWGEARSEGEDGMRAVAHVIVNRVGHRFGDDVQTVILAPKQFSAWNIGDPNRPLVQHPERYARSGINRESWETAQQVAREVLSGQSVDPTNGALFYHTRAIQPWWSRYGRDATVIGAHVFYRDVPDQPRSARRARVTQVASVTPAQRGARAGRVNGVIQYAPPAAAAPAGAPLPAATPSPEAAAAIAELPTSTSF